MQIPQAAGWVWSLKKKHFAQLGRILFGVDLWTCAGPVYYLNLPLDTLSRSKEVTSGQVAIACMLDLCSPHLGDIFDSSESRKNMAGCQNTHVETWGGPKAGMPFEKSPTLQKTLWDSIIHIIHLQVPFGYAGTSNWDNSLWANIT